MTSSAPSHNDGDVFNAGDEDLDDLSDGISGGRGGSSGIGFRFNDRSELEFDPSGAEDG